jgi:GNAT superfamily N-acetyltransferase
MAAGGGATLRVSGEEEPRLERLLEEGLTAYNAPFVGPHGYFPINVLVTRDGEDEPCGGMRGECYGGWLFIRYLFLPEDLRRQGLGAAVLARAEESARRRGCLGAWVDTFAFQARPFYEKQGYALFGTIEGLPPGHARHFLMKRFS